MIAFQDQARIRRPRHDHFSLPPECGRVVCPMQGASSVPVLGDGTMGASARFTTCTAGRLFAAVAGVTISAWLPRRLIFTITTGPSAAAALTLENGDRLQEMLEAFNAAGLRLLQRPSPVPRGGVLPEPGDLYEAAGQCIRRVMALVQDRAGCLQHRGQIGSRPVTR